MRKRFDCSVAIGWEAGPWSHPTPGVLEIETCELIPQAIISVGAFLHEGAGLTDDMYDIYDVVVRIDPPPGGRGEWRFEVWSCVEDRGWARESFDWGIGELTDSVGGDPQIVLNDLSDALWSGNADRIFEALTRLRGGSIEVFVPDD